MVSPHKKPESISQLIGNPTAFSEAKKWAQGWQDGQAQMALLVFGPTGVGKTALAHAIASEFGWELFEFNASDLRDDETVGRLLGNAASSGGLFGRRRLILIDDADSLSGREDRGGAAAIARIISAPKQPVVLTAHDYYDRKLQAIRQHCQPLKLQKVHAGTIAALLKKTAIREKAAGLSEEQISAIASSSSGDVRAALNDLFAMNTHASRDSEKNIFEVVRTILKSEKYSESRKAAFDSETEHDTLKLWVAQNITAEYEKPFEIAEAYNSISRADVFDGRISLRQYWGFLRYSTDHLSSGVSTSKSAPYRKWTQISYPDYIREMGASKSARTVRKAVLSKISGRCHCSISQAAAYLPALELAAKKDPDGVAGCFGFDESESGFVQRKKSSKKETGKKKSAKK